MFVKTQALLIALAVGMAFGAGGPALAAAATGGAHESHGGHAASDAPLQLQLDHGKKWQTDAPLRQGMTEIRAAMAEAQTAIHKSSLAPGEYAALAARVDQLIVGGGIANTFLLAAGLPIGRSLAEREMAGEARAVLDAMSARGAAVPIPEDVVCAKEFSASAQGVTKPVQQVADDDLILDIGPRTAATLAGFLQQAGTIVWNGPVGVFEFDAFAQGTRKVAEAIAQSNAYSIAGGGDTVAAISRFGVADRVDYISTGGGAFLEFLEGRMLPAVEALKQRA